MPFVSGFVLGVAFAAVVVVVFAAAVATVVVVVVEAFAADSSAAVAAFSAVAFAAAASAVAEFAAAVGASRTVDFDLFPYCPLEPPRRQTWESSDVGVASCPFRSCAPRCSTGAT